MLVQASANPKLAIQIDGADNVGVALETLVAGTKITICGVSIDLKSDIPKGHKFALSDISIAGEILKYGETIGRATQAISRGDHVHTHNVSTCLVGEVDYTNLRHVPSNAVNAVPSWLQGESFQGYLREDGRVGTRNDIWVIASVGCVNRICQQLAKHAMQEKPDHIDRVIAITHPYGCSQMDQDMLTTRAILASLAGNPNVAAALFVGLGCETNQIDALISEAPWLHNDRVLSFASQHVGDEIETGVSFLRKLFLVTADDHRQPVPASKLVVGLKCGGSDGLSGLTANPLLGRFTNSLVQAGGSAILSEIPEIFGAELLLLKRSVSQAVRADLIALVNRFKAYYADQGLVIHDNPSPGNKEGGITTLEEKSLGAVQKAGQVQVNAIMSYGQRLDHLGLSIVEAPGNDAVSITALAAAGANMILFTTGRGTPLGCPIPTLKISSNSDLAQRKANWIDFDAGEVLNEHRRNDVDRAFAKHILACASGTPARHELNGEMEIAIWKRGVTL